MKIKHNPVTNTKKICKLFQERDGVPIKYVCTTELNGDNTANDVFYRETPHPKFGNRYFAIKTF